MQKILVIKPSSFGDIVHGLQIIQSMKRQMPDVTIDWVVRDIFAPVVQRAKCVDRVFIFYRNQGLRGFLKLIQNLQQTHYDYVIDLQGLFRSAFLAKCCHGTTKIGRGDGREFSTFFYNKKIPFPKKNKPHAIEILMELLPLFGCKKELCEELEFKDGGKPKFILEEPYILMFPDSRRPEKEWPYFSELTDHILETTPSYVVWAGQKEMNYPKEHACFTNLMGKTSIADTVDLIRRASYVVTNDSGPMHLAAAMNKNIVAFFGPTNIEEFGPYPIKKHKDSLFSSPKKDISSIKVNDFHINWV